MKQLAVLAIMWLTAIVAHAQDEPEYRLELGAGAALAAYQGDFNGSLLKSMKPMGGVVAKYKPNPRMAWSALLGYTKLKGTSGNVKTWYPELTEHPISFSSSVIDVSLRYEYNFWPFGTGREYYGAQKLTPFIAMGLGLSFANADTEQDGQHQKRSSGALQMPIGMGMKYKVADRWNLAVEWTMHFTGNDKIDGMPDPYGIESSGIFKNTDCYSVLGVTLTYDLWAKCKTCHNDQD
jgi:opacity protein-like surface antigen